MLIALACNGYQKNPICHQYILNAYIKAGVLSGGYVYLNSRFLVHNGTVSTLHFYDIAEMPIFQLLKDDATGGEGIIYIGALADRVDQAFLNDEGVLGTGLPGIVIHHNTTPLATLDIPVELPALDVFAECVRTSAKSVNYVGEKCSIGQTSAKAVWIAESRFLSDWHEETTVLPYYNRH